MQLHELPHLIVGVAAGEPAALRRVLGARRSGRYGALWVVLGLLWAGGSLPGALLAGCAWVGVGAGVGVAIGAPVKAWLRLAAWVTPALLAAAALGSWIPGAPRGALIAIAIAGTHALCVRRWRRVEAEIEAA